MHQQISDQYFNNRFSRFNTFQNSSNRLSGSVGQEDIHKKTAQMYIIFGQTSCL